MMGLVVISDGRIEYLRQCLDSMRHRLLGPVHQGWIVLDEPEAREAAGAEAEAIGFKLIANPARSGLSGIVQTAWRAALEEPIEYLFHLEEDFTFNQPIELQALREVLDADERIAQVVLKRQPWSDAEVAAGGIVELHPRLYLDATVGGQEVALHKRGFSKNPCLMPRRIFARPFPDGGEGAFGDELIAAGYHFAFWGSQKAAPVITHIGERRSAGWKR
ncbi:MAG TPA: hypothetical protein VN493_27240 [Thermoanaerobaculia bacterium]|nr:hypothetical protein [Thermoanaerobaculia bacterium]